MRTEQIVAKALEQVNNDRYILSNIVFKRVKQLTNGAEILVDANRKTEKLSDIALREIAEGKLTLERIEESINH
ncbi:DNA-directed RNA polymerase subunit omega [Helicobacter fennelliae]|uniref:DNA-directed RNA polymerase subunit omega n=2 Tax=Helicobacter fennelliae TaxID=215 RepID=T1CSK7_9HELI|nr:DNA-directed RNA polymerase subunit omega [Helicobacter fennelliae]GAD19794.1 DNA-directed RNA polymerase omega subunit [Helicobacter fennelliae MRY12-0050]SQB98673.1 DNA-directed RNA polymerase subunit omega [Helicobacter fennelliae]STP08014.1 DNA-directed RNA polymerase subunit omega [Helicobacter fennelliae]STQ84077.1 DNA-directed RNA polymerase subunit omega [Helicobacter fennelliae]